MDVRRARKLVGAERERIETALKSLTGELSSENDVESQQTGESDPGSELATEMVDQALAAALRADLDAVARAEARIEAGTYGLSVESGVAIPDERLEAAPLAERTVEEQRRIEEASEVS